jgi:Flp pilus assembly protein TadB
MSTNGNGRGQLLVNALLSILLIVLGLLWNGQDKRLDRTEATAATAASVAATVKIQNDTRWDEVLRRLSDIDRKLDKDDPSRRAGR